MGSPEFAIPGLQKLHESDHEIIAVVSGPDKRRGRGNLKTPTPVKSKALKLGLPVIEVENLKDADFATTLKNLQPDLFVVVAFRILPKHLLAIPHIGSINLHASLLPKYRGAAPIHHAVISGESISGCTVFFLDEQVDTGRIVSQCEIPIGPNETMGMVYTKMMTTGADLLLDSVNMIAEGDYKLKTQNEAETTEAPKIYAKDCLIDFNRPAQEVHNFIRGLSPYPVARVYLDGMLFKVFASTNLTESKLQPFELKVDKNQVVVGCNPGALRLETVQLEGKPISSAMDFFRGYDGELNITI